MHLFIVEPSEQVRHSIAQSLGDDHAWIGHDSLAQLAKAIDRGEVPAIVLTGPGIVDDDTFMLAKSMREEGVPAALIQVTKALDPDALRSALRAGVADVVELDGPVEELRGAMNRARTQALRFAERSAAARGATGDTTARHVPVLALLAGKGGVGTSFLTTNVAAAMADAGHKVVAIDLDLASGDLAIMLQQRPSLTLIDALERIDHLDPEALDGYLVPVRKNLRLLAAPLEGGGAVNSVAFMRLLDVVEDVADVVVVDVGHGIGEASSDLVAVADHVVVVSNRELTTIRGTRLAVGRLTSSGRLRGSMTVVVNRADESTGLALRDVEKALDTTIDAKVPADKSASQSVNRGEPIIDRRRSRTGVAIRQLASTLATELELA